MDLNVKLLFPPNYEIINKNGNMYKIIINNNEIILHEDTIIYFNIKNNCSVQKIGDKFLIEWFDRFYSDFNNKLFNDYNAAKEFSNNLILQNNSLLKISVKNYHNIKNKNLLEPIKVNIDYPYKQVQYPYLAGLWLFKNNCPYLKTITSLSNYFYNTIDIRKKFFAGILDSPNSTFNNGLYTINTMQPTLNKEIISLGRSLNFQCVESNNNVIVHGDFTTLPLLIKWTETIESFISATSIFIGHSEY
jgi:hypothetical protein